MRKIEFECRQKKEKIFLRAVDWRSRALYTSTLINPSSASRKHNIRVSDATDQNCQLYHIIQ